MRLRTILVLFLAIAVAAVTGGCREEDDSPEARRAIRLAQTYQCPLGNTVAGGIVDFLWDVERNQKKQVEREGWHAFKGYTLDGFSIKPKYRVVYRFKMGSPRMLDREFAFEVFPGKGVVEPANKLAEDIMRSR